jgi:serine phosphatase RsbU (regulator of sigma subunit)
MFLRSRGKITELESTTLLLGAADDSIFGEEELTVKLEEGDTLVLFTDGAYEAQSPRGERLGLDRIREIMQRPTAPPRWTQYMMRLVETFEAGMAEDDLLIAEVNFLSRRSVSSITGDDVPIPAQRYAGAGAGSGS